MLARIVAVRQMLREALAAVSSPMLEEALAEAASFNYEQNEVITAQALLEQVQRIQADASTGTLPLFFAFRSYFSRFVPSFLACFFSFFLNLTFLFLFRFVLY